ncbi:MAG: hypothetical protein ABIB47_03300 [Candidatus Woesearchaeota archaeon]
MTPTVQDHTRLHYAPIQNRRTWYSPKNYAGALISIVYGVVWPAIVALYVSGFANTYDKYFPHRSLQDNLVGIVFKMPSEAVATATVTVLPDRLEDELGIPTYFLMYGTAGLATQISLKRIRHGRTKSKN